MRYENFGELLRFGTDAECRVRLAELYAAGLDGPENIIDPKEVHQYQRREEILEEQIHFARELIEEIREACHKHNRKADLERAIVMLIEESSFER